MCYATANTFYKYLPLSLRLYNLENMCVTAHVLRTYVLGSAIVVFNCAPNLKCLLSPPTVAVAAFRFNPQLFIFINDTTHLVPKQVNYATVKTF